MAAGGPPLGDEGHLLEEFNQNPEVPCWVRMLTWVHIQNGDPVAIHCMRRVCCDVQVTCATGLSVHGMVWCGMALALMVATGYHRDYEYDHGMYRADGAWILLIFLWITLCVQSAIYLVTVLWGRDRLAIVLGCLIAIGFISLTAATITLGASRHNLARAFGDPRDLIRRMSPSCRNETSRGSGFSCAEIERRYHHAGSVPGDVAAALVPYLAVSLGCSCVWLFRGPAVAGNLLNG
jgi:hypothetical protein